jgi:hypothetical protein
MKLSLLLIVGVLFISCDKKTNYPDRIDANTVPAPLEQRENEVINLPDSLDANTVPASQEERAKDEEKID